MALSVPHTTSYLTEHCGDDAYATLEGYTAQGGYSAAHQALRQMWMLLAFLLDAYASVAQSLIGYFLGAGRSELARRVAGVSVSWGLATGALVAIAMLALEPAVARLLVPADSLVVFGGAWPILALAQPLNAVSFVPEPSSGLLQTIAIAAIGLLRATRRTTRSARSRDG